MKRFPLLLILILAVGSLNAQQRHLFRTDRPQGFSVSNSSTTALSLHYAINELGIADIDNGKAKGHELVLSGCFASNDEGLPNLPFENRYIAIPQGAKAIVEVKENASKVFQNIDLLPATKAQRNNAKGLPDYVKDMSVFGKDENFPAQSVTLAQTTQIRKLDVVLLSVTPFRYNPVRKTLEVIYDMDIEVRFEGGNGQFGDPRYRSPEWDGILRDLVLNGEMLPEAHYYEFLNEALSHGEEGYEYLIITSDDSVALYWADTLRQFRLKQGIPTKIVTTSECGHTPDSIREYIVNAYNHWTIPPAAVLILGGYNTKNGHGVHPYHYTIPDDEYSWYFYDYPTDNPTVDVNGDSIPDLAVSRIAALRPWHYQTQIEKLIDFELNPPTNPQYYDHPIVTSGYEYNKWFTITSQSINGLYRNKIGKHPTNLYMVYSQWQEYPDLPDSLWSTAPNTPAALSYFGPDGEGYIPTSIGELHDWDYQSNKDTLLQAFQKESFLTLYRDHSATSTWCCPWFDDGDVSSMNNKIPTFIFSIGCLTLNYLCTNDNQNESLVEVMNRQEVGALGGIGAATITYTQFNDLITWGMFDYIWPNFMTSLGNNTPPNFVLPAFSLIAGKLFLTQQTFMPYGWYPERVEATLNIFGYLGETYLSLHTETPQELEADIPTYLVENQTAYTLSAEEGTKICLSKDNEILFVTTSTGEAQTFSMPALSAGERFLVTMTKQNRIRRQQEVSVIPTGVPYLYLEKAETVDQNSNGRLENGEQAYINLTVKNYGTVISRNREMVLDTDSPYVEILQGSNLCPGMEPDTEVSLEEAFSIMVSNNLPDQTELPMKVILIHKGDSVSYPFTATANAPFLVIDSDYGFTETNGKPSTHIASEGNSSIRVKISNKGHCESGPISTVFAVKAPFVEVENPHEVLESLAPGEQHTVTFNLRSNEPEGAFVQTHLEVDYNEYSVCKDTVVQYGGIYENFETDTLNPIFQWTNNSVIPWAYSEEDPYEGDRCFFSTSDAMNHAATLQAVPTSSYLIRRTSKVSFFYQMNRTATMQFKVTNTTYNLRPTEEWKFVSLLAPDRLTKTIWTLVPDYMSSDVMCKIDHICFPPMPRTILSAGADKVSCQDTPVELSDAYAYDCDSILWVTEGDGLFETDTLGNVSYLPGNQDLLNGGTYLTLQAFSDTNSYASTMRLTLLNHLDWAGDIMGDSVVNKSLNLASHYAVEPQAGLHYLWQLEPAEAGHILAYENEIDIVWNPFEGDMEAVLSLSNDNGCDMEPLVKHIRLIGTWTQEWQSLDFNLFPNPTDGQVKLVVDKTLAGKAVVEVFNLLGERMLLRETKHLSKNESLTLDLHGFAPGLYIVRMTTENGYCSKKVSLR